MEARDALAESWASIDGKLDAFTGGKNASTFNEEVEKFGGHYSGYMCEADEMIKRLERRGFKIVAVD
jgi:hypothetical protein